MKKYIYLLFIFPLILVGCQRNEVIKSHGISYLEKREKLIVMANDILLEDVPWVFLWHKGKYSITQSFVSGSFPKLIFNAEKYINWEKKSG